LNAPRHLVGAVLLAWVWPLPARANGEAQVWLEQKVSRKLDHGLEALVHVQERLEPSSNETVRQFKLTPQMIWHHSERYDCGVGYKWTETWQEDGTSDQDHEAMVFLAVNWELGDWRVCSRQRFDSGFTEDEDWMGRARHRVGVEYAGWSRSLHLRPFLENEWHFDLVEHDICENRLRGGLKYEFNKLISIEVYGMRRDQWSPAGVNQYHPIGGLVLNLAF
jgi:hypothetical protein